MKEGKRSNFSMGIKRFIAFLIDAALIYLVYILISLPNFVSGMNSPDAFKSLSDSIGATSVIIILLPLMYTTLLWSMAGATVGMLATRIRVIDVRSGRKPRLYIALWKYLLSFVSWFSIAIGHIWMLWDPQKQTLADKGSKTYVVSKVERTEGAFQHFVGDTSRWTLGKIILIVSTLIASFVVYSYHQDYPLLPEVVDCLKDYKPDTNPDNNGYYSYIAFGVEPEMNSHEMGIKIVKSINSVLIDSLALADMQAQAMIVKRHQFIDNGLPIDVNDILIAEDDKYIETMRKNKDVITKNYKQYSYLYDRYVDLSKYASFRKKLVPHFLYPSINPMSLVTYQRLFSANMVNEYISGNRAKSIELMKQGYATTTNILYNSDTLMMKLVGSIIYFIHTNASNKLIGYTDKIDSGLYDYILSLEEPGLDKISLRKAYETEFIFKIVSSLFMMDNVSDVWDDYVITPEELNLNSSSQYKMNAVANHDYLFTRHLADYSELPYHECPDKSTEEFTPKFSKFEYINNLMGMILIQVQTSKATSNYNKYSIKVRDTAISTRLQKVAVMIKRNRPKDVKAYLAKLPAELQNPYIQKPFKWDNETGTVYFEGPAHQSQKAIRSIKTGYISES